MKSTKDAWDCITWIVWLFGFVVLAVGVFIGVMINRSTTNTNVEDNNSAKPTNELVGYLDSNSPYCAIPKNTQIVATCSDESGVYAFIVKCATNEQHYVVNLYTKKVKSIPFVDVITKTETITKEEIKNL